MNKISLIKYSDSFFPPLLKEITDPPPHLHVRGNIFPLLDPDNKILCVVGSRKYSDYGRAVTEHLIAGLKGYPVCIVSGLALGIDSIAHRAALRAGLYTAAFPGSGLDPSVLYPFSHRRLADEIVESGGALLSEFDMTQPSLPYTFLQRNRLMAGVSHRTLVIECGLQSGSLVTSARATDYNRDVASVPGSIFSRLSEGPHMLIGKGAASIGCVDDLLEFLGFARRDGQSRLPLGEDPRFKTLDTTSKRLMRSLERGCKNIDLLAQELALDAKSLNIILVELELNGLLKNEGGVISIQ